MEIPSVSISFAHLLPNYPFQLKADLGKISDSLTYQPTPRRCTPARCIQVCAVGENFNPASEKEIRIKDLIKMVNEATGNKADIIFRECWKWDTKPRLLASIDKAKQLIGYESIIDFNEGFQSNPEGLREFRDNREKIESVADFPPGMSSAVRGVKSICNAGAKPPKTATYEVEVNATVF